MRTEDPFKIVTQSIKDLGLVRLRNMYKIYTEEITNFVRNYKRNWSKFRGASIISKVETRHDRPGISECAQKIQDV